jgi:hypothetical protein
MATRAVKLASRNYRFSAPPGRHAAGYDRSMMRRGAGRSDEKKDKPQPVPPDRPRKPPVEPPPDQPGIPPGEPDPRPKGDPPPNEPTRLV